MYEELIERLRKNSGGFVSSDTIKAAADVIEKLSAQNDALCRDVFELVKERRKMSVDDAIYCMKSYLPGGEAERCESCPYYGRSICRATEAHRLAVVALQMMKGNGDES